jgi:hypothetical protein
VAKEPKKNGRPTLYDTELLLAQDMEEIYTPKMIPLVARMAAIGCTDDEIAEWFGIGVKTFRKWVMIHADLSAALKPGKEIADDFVERSLFMQAVGYTVEEEKLFVVDKTVERHEVKTYIRPSTTAQIFWLKNRRSSLWKDLQKFEHGAAGEFESLSDEEVAKRLAQFVGQQPAPLQIEEPQPGITRKRDGSKLN